MICCSCGKEIDINYGREYWNGIYCKKCADEMLSTPEYIKNYKRIIADLQAENAALRERLEKAYEFPVKYGDKIWVLDGKHLFDRYVWAIEIKSNGVFLSLSEKTMWYDRGIVSLSERGKTWFLDSEKELAEARLAELNGGKE